MRGETIHSNIDEHLGYIPRLQLQNYSTGRTHFGIVENLCLLRFPFSRHLVSADKNKWRKKNRESLAFGTGVSYWLCHTRETERTA